MSAEDDLKKYRRDQDLFFQELEDKQRRSQQLVTAKEFADALEKRGGRLENFAKLEKQLLRLGRLAGMSDAKSEQWAASLVTDAKLLILKGTK